jgi:hypothetical protein
MIDCAPKPALAIHKFREISTDAVTVFNAGYSADESHVAS